jgi:hypothetical protein
MLAGFIETIKQGEIDFHNNDLGRLLNKKATSLRNYLKRFFREINSTKYYPHFINTIKRKIHTVTVY